VNTEVYSQIALPGLCSLFNLACQATPTGDLPEQEQRLLWATHYAPAADLFSRNAPGTAWRSKPSWYVVANKDRTVHPELQRFLAKRMGATVHAVDSSHVAMLSHPSLVVDVIRAAAKAVQGSSATA
jgi:pimeloyl-ACP methyl ester carboxylesterase